MSISKQIIAPRDLILNSVVSKNIALFFDEIWIWPIDSNSLSAEDELRLKREMEFLRDNGVVKLLGIDPASPVNFGAGVKSFSEFFQLPKELLQQDMDMPIPFEIFSYTDDSPYHIENPADMMVRLLSYRLQKELNVPLSAYLSPANMLISGQSFNSIELIINNLPIPPVDISWEDLIQFRYDTDQVNQLARLRLCLQKYTSPAYSYEDINEEIRYLINEHEKLIENNFKRKLKTAFSCLTAVSPNFFPNLNPYVSALITLAPCAIYLNEGESCGNTTDLAYFTSAKKLLTRGV